MRGWLLVLSFVLGWGLAFPKSTSAALVNVAPQGEVVLKVLSASDSTALGIPKPSPLDVTKVAQAQPSDQEIYLTKSGDKISLRLGLEEELDVTNWVEDLVEIEARGDTKKINIFLQNNQFGLAQGGFSALTAFPIKVSPKENKFFLSTPSGDKYLAILPSEAAQSALRSKAVGEIMPTPFELGEVNSDLCYTVTGEKVINLFNLYNLKTTILAKVSGSTGEVISTNEPVWLKILGLLFS